MLHEDYDYEDVRDPDDNDMPAKIREAYCTVVTVGGDTGTLVAPAGIFGDARRFREDQENGR